MNSDNSNNLPESESAGAMPEHSMGSEHLSNLLGQSTSADGGLGLDLGSMMEMAQNMQQQAAEAQQKLADEEVSGSAGGGIVGVTLNGHLHLKAIRIQPNAIDPDDPSMIEDLLLAAWQDAHDQVAVLQAAADPMSGLLGGLGGGNPLGGLGDLAGPGGLDGLGGLAGDS